MNTPKVIKGNSHKDHRGSLSYNNLIDLSFIKRMYIIQNENTNIKRGWQGHKIEQRWFSVLQGSFKIQLIKIDDWKTPSKDLDILEYVLKADKLDILHLPAGYISCLQSLEPDSKLIVFANYLLGDIEDEYRFENQYFKKTS